MIPDIPEWVEPYIDWAAMARDWVLDYDVLNVPEGVAIFGR